MKSKKKILFVIESLALAGSERSCVSLLNNLNPDLYDIDLQLFHYGGELEAYLPDTVNVLPPLKYTEYVQNSWKQNILDLLKGKNKQFFKSRLVYSLKLRRGSFNHPQKAQLYWETVGPSIQKSEINYDVAIAFAQGVPTFYVMDKVVAKHKVCWVNTNLIFQDKNNKNFNFSYYVKYDHVVAISKGTKNHMIGLYLDLKPKIHVITNIIDHDSILKMSSKFSPEFNTTTFNIVTVGRLNNKMKGMDITIEACKELKNRGVNFHWYIIGEGGFRSEMEQFIESNELQNHVSLLGSTNNPYPYFKAADLYVQTSRHEGYGRTIAEARMLNLPIVTTNFDTVGLQIQHLKNGIITDINPEAVADGIQKIMSDKDLYLSIKEYLRKEPKENTETIKLFDQMIEDLLSVN